jgi:hypothetical protein
VTYEITLKNAVTPGLPAPVDFTKESRAAAVVGSSAKEGLDMPAPSPVHADDIVLDEGERILADYAGAMKGSGAPDLSLSSSR